MIPFFDNMLDLKSATGPLPRNGPAADETIEKSTHIIKL
jgi:hypothetical protein